MFAIQICLRFNKIRKIIFISLRLKLNQLGLIYKTQIEDPRVVSDLKLMKDFQNILTQRLFNKTRMEILKDLQKISVSMKWSIDLVIRNNYKARP